MNLELSRARLFVLGEGLAQVARLALPDAGIDHAAAAGEAGRLAAAGAADLLLIDADEVDASSTAVALAAIARERIQPAVLLAGARLPASLARAMIQLERADVIERPFTAEALARDIETLLARRNAAVAPAPVQTSHCWAITGAVGGAGATTLAVESACLLAARPGAGRVALVDLNLADAASPAYLGARAAMTLAEAAATPERIDATMLPAFAAEAGRNLDLFAAPRDPEGFARVGPLAVTRLLEAACHAYAFVVVDCPRVRQPWTLDVLAGADEIVVVSELTVPALLSARALAAEIDGELARPQGARIILNRVASRMFGPAPSLAEAEKALGRKADGGITSDWEAAACSVNLGGPIGEHRPRSKIVRDVGALVDRLLAADAARGARAA